MFRSFPIRFSIFILVSVLVTVPRSTTKAQTALPRAGQSFSFGIIEGPYSFTDSASFLAQTSLTLTVVSAYSGCGTVMSPSGYSQDFSFAPGTPTIINLPLNLIHINDLGKTNKGLLVHTTQPVNLVLHDYVQYGGDATQIIPDNALDTSYAAFGWGIWDDQGEHDAEEFIVTAMSDSTYVTITPSVKTMMGQADSVPFTTMLNRGECYIVKADTSGHPVDPSLSGSRIVSTKPVSVISGLTCAYVPLQVEACNELMDELIGKKWWGSHFFVQPINVNDTGGELVLTSNSDFVAKINSNTYNSFHGRLALTFSGNLEIHTSDGQSHPFPVEAHQLTRSYSFSDSSLGDPSLVTVLDTSYYADTILWNTPSYFFSHTVPIICPTADLGIATLDGVKLSQLGVPTNVINGSSFSALNPPVQSGEHRIVSPVPVFAIAAGFFEADAYTFVPGTAGSKQPLDSTGHAVILKADTARTCSEFYVTASLGTPILSAEGVLTFTISITYDASILQLLGIVPQGVLTNATYTVDTSVAGTVTIKITGNPFITGSDLFKLLFEAKKTTPATTVGLNSGATTICGSDSEIISGLSTTFPVLPSMDSLRRKFLLTVTNAALCQPLTLSILTDSNVLPIDGLVLSKIVVQYNLLNEQLTGSNPGSLLVGKTYTQVSQPPGNYQLLMAPPTLLSGGNSVLILHFMPQKPSLSDTIRVRIYYLECGDTLTRDLLVAFPIARNNAFDALKALAFDSTMMCNSHDTIIVLGDTSCLPLTLTKVSVSGSDWTLLNTNGTPLGVPAPVGGYNGLPILVRFHPKAIGEDQDSITVTYTYLDSTYTTTIQLDGLGKAAGTVQYSHLLNFGNASLCLPVDSPFTIINQSCDTAKVDSVRVTAPFKLVSKLPFVVKSGSTGGVKMEYGPHTVSTDTGFAYITLTIDGVLVTDTITLIGNGTSTGTVQYPHTFAFGSVATCIPLDTQISFKSTSCDTAFIDSVYVEPPFFGQPPIKISPNGSGSLKIRFAPDSIANDTGYAVVVLTVNGLPVYDTIRFIGTGKPSGTVQYGHTLDFGTTSLCSHIDTLISFNNLTCDRAEIDSVGVLPPFTVLGQVPITIDTGASGGVRVEYTPHSNTTDSGRVVIKLTENGSTILDTVTFIGRGGGGGGANLLSTIPSDTITVNRFECDPPDTAPFSLYNPGCDSLQFKSGFNIFRINGGIGSWKIISQPTPSLGAGDTSAIGIISNDSAAGQYIGRFETSYIDSNGVEQQYVLWLIENVTAATRIMTLDTAPIDLGTNAPCQPRDTVLPYTNMSCVPVNVIGWTLTSWTDNFNVFGTGKNPPYPILPGGTDSLHITFDGSQPGVHYDTVIVFMGTDKDSTRRIPIQTFVPIVDSANFQLQMPATLSAGQHFAVGVYPDRAVSASKGLTSVSGRFLYPDNDFYFDSIKPAAGLTLNSVAPTPVNGVDHLDFVVSNPLGFPLDPATPIVQLWLESSLTDSIDYSVKLDSVLLNGGDATFSQCTLATVGSAVSAQYTSACADSLLIEALQGSKLLFSSVPVPNPVTGDGVSAELTLQSIVDGVATIEVCDALGRAVSQQHILLKAGQAIECPLDLHAAPSGSYFYTIRYTSPMGTVARYGSISLIR